MTALEALAWPVVALTGLGLAWALARDWLQIHQRRLGAVQVGEEVQRRVGERMTALEIELRRRGDELVELREYVVRLDNRTQLAPGSPRR